MKLLLALLLLAAVSQAAENPVSWALKNLPKNAVRTGSALTLHLLAEIQPGWHVYSLDQEEEGPIAMEISLTHSPGFELGSITAPKAVTLFDPNFSRKTSFYVDKAAFLVPIKVLFPSTLTIQVHYQSCNDKMCLPPKTVEIDTPVQVKAAK